MQANSATLAIFLAASTLAGCSPAPFPPGTGAIVSLDLFEAASCGQLPAQHGPWRPAPNDIAMLDRVLSARIVSESRRFTAEYESRPRKPEDYFRRYTGVTVNERRMIAICGEIRGLYANDVEAWRASPIRLHDGGDETFGAYYDPTTRAITYFEFGYMA